MNILQDANILISTVNQKADQEDVSGIESNLIQVSHQLGQLNEVLQKQNSSIRDLNSRVSMLTEELEDLRNPNYDQIFSYVDRQVPMKVAVIVVVRVLVFVVIVFLLL